MDELEEKYGEIFSAILNNINYDLQKNNHKYISNIDKCVKIVDKYPNVRLVCEDNTPVALNVEEVKALITYYQCYKNRETMQDKKLVYVGFKCAYTVFKNAGLLREDINLDDILQY